VVPHICGNQQDGRFSARSRLVDRSEGLLVEQTGAIHYWAPEETNLAHEYGSHNACVPVHFREIVLSQLSVLQH
jgi:hypothetical protein